VKILLVNPQWAQEAYFGKFAEAKSLQQPLGPAYLASVLENANHDVKLVDAAAIGIDIDGVLAEIRAYAPDLIGISTVTPSFSRALLLAKEIKSQLNAKVVVGGPHVTALPAPTLRNECFDIGVVGEGEHTVLDLVRGIDSGADLNEVKGIVYRENGEIRQNPTRPYIDDLDSLPFPARHLLPPLETYRPTPSAYKRLPQGTMITSRGCPYHCTFCDRAVFGNKYRARSAGNVVDEMEILIQKHGAKEVRFWDDTFNIDSRRVIRICEEIRTRGIDVPWTCLARINHMNEEVLQAMADAGCWQVDYGIESGNQKVLNSISKGLTLDLVRRVTRMTRNAGIRMRGFFMLGLPGESEETMRQTIEFAKELNLAAAVFHVTTPFPGTELYQSVVESGELDSSAGWDDYSIFTSHSSPYVPRGLTRETIQEYQTKANREFYFRLTFILRQLLGIRSLSDLGRYVTGFSVVRSLR
jgi:radical SAM superfamily enzyme YgiQ (UPF0313 family)